MATTLKENVTVEMHTFTAEDARGILHRTGCKVQVRSRGGGPRILTITGAPEQVMAARSQALNILAGLHPLRAPLFASSASSAGAQVGAAAASAGCYSWTTARQYYQIN